MVPAQLSFGSATGGPWLPRTVLAMSPQTRTEVLPPGVAASLAATARVDLDLLVQDFAFPGHAQSLAAAEILLTGWGVPRVDTAALASMPNLRAIVHAAGSVKRFISQQVFDRGIQVSSCATANAVPVAEFTVAAIIFATKRVGRFATRFRAERTLDRGVLAVTGVGTNALVVGVIGASHVGRRVIAMLGNLDVHVLLADPYLDKAGAAALNAELVEIDDLVRRSDVVTLHAPDSPTTRHLIDGRRLALMSDGAILVNTARGSLVDTAALVAELVSGRLDAVLDVTDPEPLPADSPLYELPNVQLTPHIAGAMGNEVSRLGELAVAEIERLATGLPLAHPVRPQDLPRIA